MIKTLFFLSLALLVGCGQKGDLYLPKDAPNYKNSHFLLYPNHNPADNPNTTNEETP